MLLTLSTNKISFLSQLDQTNHCVPLLQWQGRIQSGQLGGEGIEAKIGRKGANFARFWPILEMWRPHAPFWICHWVGHHSSLPKYYACFTFWVGFLNPESRGCSVRCIPLLKDTANFPNGWIRMLIFNSSQILYFIISWICYDFATNSLRFPQNADCRSALCIFWEPLKITKILKFLADPLHKMWESRINCCWKCRTKWSTCKTCNSCHSGKFKILCTVHFIFPLLFHQDFTIVQWYCTILCGNIFTKS